MAGSQKRLLRDEYKTEDELFDDMARVFANAIKFNEAGTWWHEEAARLLLLLKALRKHKMMGTPTWTLAPELADKCRCCPRCNNLMLSASAVEPVDCIVCGEDVRPRDASFTCHNHMHNALSFCEGCVKALCDKCGQVCRVHVC